MLRVYPIRFKTSMPIKNEPGMARPTNIEERGPRDATMMIITRTVANNTLLKRSSRVRLISLDWSWLKVTMIPSGHFTFSLLTRSLTSSRV